MNFYEEQLSGLEIEETVDHFDMHSVYGPISRRNRQREINICMEMTLEAREYDRVAPLDEVHTLTMRSGHVYNFRFTEMEQDPMRRVYRLTARVIHDPDGPIPVPIVYGTFDYRHPPIRFEPDCGGFPSFPGIPVEPPPPAPTGYDPSRVKRKLLVDG